VAVYAARSGDVVTGANTDGVNDEISFMHLAVLEFEATEDLTSVNYAGQLASWRTMG
jgi:hypothetical protein